MSLQQELTPLISRLRQATERLDWKALAVTHMQLVRLLVKTRELQPTDQPTYQSLCDAHAQACQAIQKAERVMQGEVQTLQDILAAGAGQSST